MLDQQHVKMSLDTAAFSSVLASFIGLLNPTLEAISLLLSIIWLSIQIYGKWKGRK